MIDYTTGNILDDDAEALVNTVNTVGVMGKGIALQFKRRFPANYDAYRKACEAGEVEPGGMFVWHTGQLGNPQHIINFPTKRHWKANSRVEDIEAGLRDLRRVVVRLGVTSLAVPPLGCGSGGLEWSVVRGLLDRYLTDLDGVHVRVYEPAGAPTPASMPAQTKVPRLTAHRAAMLVAFARYLQPGFTLGRLEAQKLIYFLKVAGVPFDKLKFVQGTYGPYADPVRHVLNEVEGHFIEGFGDAASPSAIQLRGDVVDQAEAMLDEVGNEQFRHAVETVAAAIAGFDDAFGLELLASVHWVATHGDPPARNASEALRMIHEWSSRKRNRYDTEQVRMAWRRLQAHGLVRTMGPEDSRARPVVPEPELPVPEGDLLATAL